MKMDEKALLTDYLAQMTRFALQGKQKDASLYAKRMAFRLYRRDREMYKPIIDMIDAHVGTYLRPTAVDMRSPDES